MKRISWKVVCISILAVMVVAGWGLFFRQANSGYAAVDKGQIIRLHVIANSDSCEDQAVKLQVRDAVVEYLTPLLAAAKTSDESRRILMEQQDTLLSIAQQVLKTYDKNYSANLEFGWFEFPLKSYGTMVFPAGQYEAMRIVLGKAEGKNWWCVLFPPLCFIDGANATAVPIIATDSQQQENQSINIEFKSKIGEFFK